VGRHVGLCGSGSDVREETTSPCLSVRVLCSAYLLDLKLQTQQYEASFNQ